MYLYGPDPPENCHLNVKKLPKTWFFKCQKYIFLKMLSFLAIFWNSNGNFPFGRDWNKMRQMWYFIKSELVYKSVVMSLKTQIFVYFVPNLASLLPNMTSVLVDQGKQRVCYSYDRDTFYKQSSCPSNLCLVKQPTIEQNKEQIYIKTSQNLVYWSMHN